MHWIVSRGWLCWNKIDKYTKMFPCNIIGRKRKREPLGTGSSVNNGPPKGGSTRFGMYSQKTTTQGPSEIKPFQKNRKLLDLWCNRRLYRGYARCSSKWWAITWYKGSHQIHCEILNMVLWMAWSALCHVNFPHVLSKGGSFMWGFWKCQALPLMLSPLREGLNFRDDSLPYGVEH